MRHVKKQESMNHTQNKWYSKNLKETMSKELKKSMRTMFHQTENPNLFIMEKYLKKSSMFDLS